MTSIGFAFSAGVNRWISDVITASTSNMVIRVEFADTEDSCTIERSITGVDWVAAGTTPSARVYETNVVGHVEGQQLRVVTRTEPSVIGYLE
jgi:hypothetical protein